LKGDETGELLQPPDEIDVEVREIKAPWLKWKCNFVVRYIVPSRQNILQIMENDKKFKLTVRSM
jgi:hypothetical protein